MAHNRSQYLEACFNTLQYSLIETQQEVKQIVITEILSAQGDKNSASSAQKNSHSWHKVNSTAQQKGQNYTKWPKN
jgi:hypothetical protein